MFSINSNQMNNFKLVDQISEQFQERPGAKCFTENFWFI